MRWDEFQNFLAFLLFFFESQSDFIKNKVKTQKIFEKIQWDDFHFGWKMKMNIAKKVTKNTISEQSNDLIQFINVAWTFLGFYFIFIFIII